MTSQDRRLAALAEVAAIEDHADRAHAAARAFGRRWVDVLMMWGVEGGRFGGAS